MKTLQIVGRKKAGKTSLVVRLLPLLRARGMRVGSVKHSSHPHPLDREGSDSWQHRQAGAEATMAISAASVSLHFPVPERETETAALVERYLGELDLVLIEGWAGRRGPKIEVLPPDKQGRPRPPRTARDELLAVVLSPNFRPPAEELVSLGVALRGIGGAPGAGEGEVAQRLVGFLWEDVQAVAQTILDWYEG